MCTKRLLAILGGSLALGVCCLAGTSWVQAADPKPAGWTPELMFKAKGVAEVSVAPDGKRVAFAVSTPVMEGEHSEWLSQIYVSTNGSGQIQLTRGDKSATNPAWSPDGQWIAFLTPRAGPKANVWRIPVAGGEAEQLTDEKGGVTAFLWSPDGSQIAFLMADPKSDAEDKAEREKRDAFVVNENHKRSRLYVVSIATGADGNRAVRRLTGGDLHVGGLLGGRNFDWSPDGTHIVFTHQPTPLVDDWQKTDLSLVEVATARVTTLVATTAAETQPVFSPDGRLIAYTASEAPPQWAFASRVIVVKSNGQEGRPLAETFDLKPAIVGWSKTGDSVLIAEVQRTINRLSALPVDGAPQIDLSPAGLMVEQPAVNVQHSHVAFISESPDRAPEAFLSPLSAFKPQQVSAVQDLPHLPFGKTSAVQWKSTDSREIEGLLTLPVGYKTGEKVPLLVIVHGGPTGVFVQNCTVGKGIYPIAVFASRGYAVLRCNVRGSSGYGKEFRYANYNDWGGGDYRDIMSGVDALIELGIADPERLGVMGWSYGGYMTSWIITQTKRFKAASVGAGVTNLMSFTGTADISDFIPDYMGGDYWEQFDRWRAHSAMFHIKGVTTPTLIQHGDKDARVPISQGYELHNALKRQGTPVKMVVYPRQPHSLQEPKLQLDAMQRNVEWFDHWLGKNGKT
ncbi:MAG TPA: S9 family peptidase [Planctomycetaceae bacterium]|jgi:dipeptidyl aminopeptidase/acylaminoacyl peptidase